MLLLAIYLIGAVALLVFGYWVLDYMAILKEIEPVHSEYTEKPITHSEPVQNHSPVPDAIVSKTIT